MLKKCLKIIILLLTIMVFNETNINQEMFFESSLIKYANSNNQSEFVYLSDLEEEKDLSYVKDGYYLKKDKNYNSGLITVNIDGKSKSFIKGISAWATSNLVYDLSSYDYDYFTAYIGIDAKETSTYYNSGVSFTISTSKDGITWSDEVKSKTLKGFDDAILVKVNIKDQKYLKLYAYENGNSWYSHWYDDAVYANAKLIKEGYEEEIKTFPFIKTLDEYDELIKNNYSNILVLQRTLVSKVGYDILVSLANYSEEYQNTIKWLMEDESLLELYLLGGEPDGNYASSFKILKDLYEKYNDDLDNELYLKMMVSLSLTHSANVGLWVTGAPEDPLDPNGSSATKRYEIFKELYEDGLLENSIFENLSVEEMRFVMNNIIDDEEIKWLNSYTKETKKLNPYDFITYRFGYDYNNAKYYDYTNYKMWDAKYHLSQFNITYKTNYPKLWSVFEEGAVCGGISKTGSNIKGVYGIPSSVISQPGHAAYIYLNLDQNGNKVWELYNDVSGWAMSGKTEKLSVRMPNGWGSGTYAGDYPASYILLSQAALNNYEKYALSEKKLMLADIYDNKEEIYNEALDILNINFDAWLGLVNLYESRNASENEYIVLAKRIADNLTYYPLPMYDLLRNIESHITSNENISRILKIINDALNNATNATNENVLQPGPTKTVANYLLDNNETKLASFSFDGEHANEIVLASRYEDSEVVWEYNLNSGINESDWIRTSGRTHLLTDEEIKLIHPKTDIKVRIVGVLDHIYNIDIKKSLMPNNVYNNDLENKLYNVNDTMEWQENDGNWISFSDEEPNLDGDKIINIRVKNNKDMIASDMITFHFTNNNIDETKKYIPINRLSIDSVSSQELKSANNAVNNAIDGNINTMWHTNWDGSDNEKYLIIKLDKRAFVSKIDYIPRQDGLNGIVSKIKIEASMDKENWQTIKEEDLALNNDVKTINIDENIESLYLKITGLKTYGNYMSASMFNLYEDVTKISEPTADIEYNHTYLTNQDVEAKLVNPSKKITINNNNNSDTYIFKENGEFTFNYTDEYGNVGSTTAKVDWIDKELNATISYEKITNSEVVKATINSDEKITVLNNNGSNEYYFYKNGEFTFEIVDEAGNMIKQTAKVDWLKSEEKENSNKTENQIIEDNIEENKNNSNIEENKNNSNIEDNKNNSDIEDNKNNSNIEDNKNNSNIEENKNNSNIEENKNNSNIEDNNTIIEDAKNESNNAENNLNIELPLNNQEINTDYVETPNNDNGNINTIDFNEDLTISEDNDYKNDEVEDANKEDEKGKEDNNQNQDKVNSSEVLNENIDKINFPFIPVIIIGGLLAIFGIVIFVYNKKK